MNHTSAHPLLNGRPSEAPARPDGAPWPMRDAAAFLSISERTLATLVADGRVRSIKVGGRRLVPDDELKRVAREGTG